MPAHRKMGAHTTLPQLVNERLELRKIKLEDKREADNAGATPLGQGHNPATIRLKVGNYNFVAGPAKLRGQIAQPQVALMLKANQHHRL